MKVFSLFLSCFLIFGCTKMPVAKETSMAIEFRCLWWTEKQQEGLDPNNPPPKTEEVSLSKWEYSDPVGVPNPAKIIPVVKLSYVGANKVDGQLKGYLRWKIGPTSDKNKAKWLKKVPLKELPIVKMAKGEVKEVRLAAIEIKREQQRWFYKQQWPWALELHLELSPELKTTAVLPIHLGD